MSREMIPQYDTKLMTEIWEDAAEFLADYKSVGIPTTISDASATTLYYLLYARYGNNPIANYDETQFKYKVFSVIFQYGPTWEKRLSVQSALRSMSLSDLVDNGQLAEIFSSEGETSTTTSGTNGNTRTLNTQEANTGTQAIAHTGTVRTVGENDVENSGNDTVIDNHAFNPGTAPANNAFDPLAYVNEQKAQKVTKGTRSEQDTDSTVTYANTDTTTNNLSKADTGTITDAGTTSGTVSGTDSKSNSTTTTMTAGKLKAYEKLLELLDSDVTGEFISKFKICFKQFVMPERTWIYVTDLDDEEDEAEDDE